MNLKLFIIIFLAVLINGCSSAQKSPVTTEPIKSVEEWVNTGEGLVQTGVASWYGDDFHGKRTANGEVYDMEKLTAAHKDLPFHTLLEVRNLENNRKVMVRVNDRGPFKAGRIIDLSRGAAQRIGIEETGTARVRIRILKPGELSAVSLEEPGEPGGKSLEKEKIIASVIAADAAEKGISSSSAVPVSTPSSESISTSEVSVPPGEIPPAVQSSTPGGYYLQVGAFSSHKNAQRLKRRIEQLLPDISFRIELSEGLYKIFSNQLDSLESAEVVKKLLQENGIEGFIREE